MSLITREDIAGYVDEATNGVPEYKIEETVSSGFVDITTIENVHSFWHRCPGVDYKRARDIIKLLVDGAGGFTSLSDTQKNIACIHKLGTFDERITFIGHVVNLQYMKVYNLNTAICRDSRLFEAELQVRNELPDNHKDILGEARTAILDYKFFAVEGTPNNDLEGILDYIWGTAGTTWDAAGLFQKAWVPETMSLNDLCSLMNDIVSSGKYFFTMPQGKSWILL